VGPHLGQGRQIGRQKGGKSMFWTWRNIFKLNFCYFIILTKENGAKQLSLLRVEPSLQDITHAASVTSPAYIDI
jgi:hypothetical protein